MNVRNEVRWYGPLALLVTPGAGVSPPAFAHAVSLSARADVVEVVPAAATVLVVLADRGSLNEVNDWLADLAVSVGCLETDVAGARDLVLDVVYDGPDLASVADGSGLSVSDVVALHSSGIYRCEFCGFAPGFAYLSGLDPALVLPRRSTPRTSVPAGSVAIAGPYSTVYPSASPGGWHLLGRTDAVLWDPAADSPALITPGTRVMFRPVPESGCPQSRTPGLRTTRSASGTEDNQIRERGRAALRVISPGWSTSCQDRGRCGLAALGVSRSGALDRARRDLVNRLVGNAGDDAVIETAGGLVLEAVAPVVVADSTTGAVRTLVAGERVAVDPRDGELWAYLAVRGGFDVEPVLGSRSWDNLSKLGPPPPERDDLIPVGPDPRSSLATDHAPPAPHPEALTVRVWRGPRLDWFVDGAFDQLVATPWTASADVSRVGVRLRGPALQRRTGEESEELPSEGVVAGAIQVPPDGQPVVMLSDHPTTGGYPVIGVVDDADLDLLAQSRPGRRVCFRPAVDS